VKVQALMLVLRACQYNLGPSMVECQGRLCDVWKVFRLLDSSVPSTGRPAQTTGKVFDQALCVLPSSHEYSIQIDPALYTDYV
jgi:hypothetical protein